MDATNRWIKQFNDYTSIRGKSIPVQICHYTKFEDLKSIIINKCFWATKIQEFKDPNEGVASLKALKNIDDNFDNFDSNAKAKISNIISYDHNLKEYINRFPGYVVCFSTDINSTYMKTNFNSNDTSYGRECSIVFDTQKLLNSLSIVTKNNKIRKGIFKYGNIIYDESRQNAIVNSEIQNLWNYLYQDPTMNIDDRIEYLLRKVYYLGTYFKIPHENINLQSPKVSAQEKEYRILVNLCYDPKGIIVNLLPEEYEESNNFEKRHHINIQYGLESIDCVYVDSSDDKKELTDELHKHLIDNLKIKVRH